MTLFELLMALSEALEEAEKTENAKVEKPEPEPKMVFALSVSTVTVTNGKCTDHNNGCIGVFTDLMSALEYAVENSLPFERPLSVEKINNTSYHAYATSVRKHGSLVHYEYTINTVPLYS